jgi:outer membrane lipoprotein-sorting protein
MLKTFLATGAVLVLCFSAAAFVDPATAREELSAAEIVNRNVAARGGLQAWRAVQTISMEGKMGAGGNQRPSAPVEPPPGKKLAEIPSDPRPKNEILLPFTIDLGRPRKERIELLVGGKNAIQIYDGEKGWKLRPYLNRLEVEPFSDAELKASATQSELDGYLVDYAAKGTAITLEGVENVEGHDTYRLKLKLKNGRELHDWVDARTYLETKVEGLPRQFDGIQHPVEIYYRDYRQVDGLAIPFVLETMVLAVTRTGAASLNPPVQVEKIIIDKVQVNAKFDASLFSKPVIETATARKTR